jgi:hypothetical protein
MAGSQRAAMGSSALHVETAHDAFGSIRVSGDLHVADQPASEGRRRHLSPTFLPHTPTLFANGAFDTSDTRYKALTRARFNRHTGQSNPPYAFAVPARAVDRHRSQPHSTFSVPIRATSRKEVARNGHRRLETEGTPYLRSES